MACRPAGAAGGARALQGRYHFGFMQRPPRISPADSDAAFAAAQCVVETHRRLVEFIRVGQTLAQIDAEVARVLEGLGCRSAFRWYRPGRQPPFPSHSCLSLNECIVHGTAGYCMRGLRAGDLLKLDIGVFHRGWVGDAGWTYAIKEVSDENRKLMACGKESLRLGMQQLRSGNAYMEWAKVVQNHVERVCGFHCIRGLGGHGYGRKLHEPPYISNVTDPIDGWHEALWKCEPGVLLAVEPMIGAGTGKKTDADDVWPVFTADGSMSVHYEADVLITESGPRDLTEGMAGLPEVIG